ARKAHYTAEQLAKLEGVHLKFDRPFFKEFTLEVDGHVPTLLQRLLAGGYHAGLHLGRWYPRLDCCVSVAVTEKRTREDIDGLVRDWDVARRMAQTDALIDKVEKSRAQRGGATSTKRKARSA